MLPMVIRAVRAIEKSLVIWEQDGFWAMQGRAFRKARSYARGGPSALEAAARRPCHLDNPDHVRDWWKQYQPGPRLLDQFRATAWPTRAPKFSLILPAAGAPADRVARAVAGVRGQTYANWELIVIGDTPPSPDERVRTLSAVGGPADVNVGLAAMAGDYAMLLDPAGRLEPHALHRFAAVALADAPDLLFADEALTGDDLDDVRTILARCRYSHDYFLSHPRCIGRPLAVRAAIVRRATGFDPLLNGAHEIDWLLRILESAATTAHVADVLHRRPAAPANAGEHSATGRAIERHLARIGVAADVVPRTDVEFFYDVRYRSNGPAKVAILIPTKNQAGLLRACVESLERTVPPHLADVIVIDHQSDAADARTYLSELAGRHTVVPYSGPFNFAAIMNHGVAKVRGRGHSHYLFLNNDTEAVEPGWLEHMLGFARRPDVGIVGSTLLFDDDTVQHAGVVIGLTTIAEHAHRAFSLLRNYRSREPGQNGGLLANREYNAVTAACMLMRADAFERVRGYDERLAVGYNDTDICLRARAAGYKVIQDAYAVLYHHESKSRGKNNKHENDTRLFLNRYRDIIAAGDDCWSPLLSIWSFGRDLDPLAKCPAEPRVRRAKVELPPATTSAARAAA